MFVFNLNHPNFSNYFSNSKGLFAKFNMAQPWHSEFELLYYRSWAAGSVLSAKERRAQFTLHPDDAESIVPTSE